MADGRYIEKHCILCFVCLLNVIIMNRNLVLTNFLNYKVIIEVIIIKYNS